MYIIVWAAHLLVFSAVCYEVGRASTWVETARISSQGCVDCMSKDIVGLRLTGSLVGAVAMSLVSATFARGIVLLTTYAGLYPSVLLFASLGCSPSFGGSSCALRCTRSTLYVGLVLNRRRGSTHEAARSLVVWLRRGRQSILEHNCKSCFLKISARTYHRYARYDAWTVASVVYAVVSNAVVSARL